jgi:hypothetical protein
VAAPLLSLRPCMTRDTETFNFIAYSRVHVSFSAVQSHIRSRDTVVGVATRYGLEGPGIESRWGRDFPHVSRPALRPTQPPVQWTSGLSRG